jgi:hypothetical protein
MMLIAIEPNSDGAIITLEFDRVFLIFEKSTLVIQ